MTWKWCGVRLQALSTQSKGNEAEKFNQVSNHSHTTTTTNSTTHKMPACLVTCITTTHHPFYDTSLTASALWIIMTQQFYIHLQACFPNNLAIIFRITQLATMYK
jgi:hypothetical protein